MTALAVLWVAAAWACLAPTAPVGIALDAVVMRDDAATVIATVTNQGMQTVYFYSCRLPRAVRLEIAPFESGRDPIGSICPAIYAWREIALAPGDRHVDSLIAGRSGRYRLRAEYATERRGVLVEAVLSAHFYVDLSVP